ncbi:MAG TPA: nucleotidyltransferase domain-containing protein [Solirubrobacteraceae bacterium]|jgi:predicted nucleotidyltransferase
MYIYIDSMMSLTDASLSPDEQMLLERFVFELEQRLKDEMHAVWLFGSRARGEKPAQNSDVDVLVLVDDASWDGRMRVRGMLDDAARELGLDALTWSFSVHVQTLEWLAQRREIESFFIAEVDHDKIALCGSV